MNKKTEVLQSLMERMVFGNYDVEEKEMSKEGKKKKSSRKYTDPSEEDILDYLDGKEPDEGMLKIASELRELSNLWRGVGMGLILGIIGNLFVSHFYGIFSAVIKLYMGEEWLNLLNLIGTVVLLGGMIILAKVMVGRIKHLEYWGSTLESDYYRKKRFLELKKQVDEKQEKEDEDEEDED
jgi:hypothetical protein